MNDEKLHTYLIEQINTYLIEHDNGHLEIVEIVELNIKKNIMKLNFKNHSSLFKRKPLTIYTDSSWSKHIPMKIIEEMIEIYNKKYSCPY